MTRRLLFLAVSLSILLIPLQSMAGDDPLVPDAPSDYELHKLLVDTINQVERNYVKPIDRRRLVEAAIRGVLRELDDYSGYVAPNRMDGFQRAISHQFGGIGIHAGMESDQLKVISAMVGSPAYRAGLIAGDRILEIDGKPTKDLPFDEAVSLLKGDTGTSVTLKIRHPGRNETEEISLTRGVIRLETVLGDARDEEDRWDYLLDDDSRIGYVRITGFGRNTADDLRTVLKGLETDQVAGLIVDLRFNPGGLLSSAIQVADLFVSEGKIVSTAGRNVKEHTWDAKKQGTFEGFPVAVLVNRYSASASEIVAACLQDHGRAVVMGERTYGKGSVQRVIEMEGGQSAIKLTTAGYHRPNGKNIDRHPGDTSKDEWGVKPNDGFDLVLSDKDIAALDQYRRDRDLLKAPSEGDAAPLDPVEPVSSSGSRGKLEETEFVDRQLEMAMEYLEKQLTKQVAERSGDSGPGEGAELAKVPEGAAEPVANANSDTSAKPKDAAKAE